MRLFSILAVAVSAALVAASPAPRAATSYAGYLISTFTDANPKVQFYLSNGNNALSYKFSNKGKAVLASTVGTKAVRDIFLAHSTLR